MKKGMKNYQHVIVNVAKWIVIIVLNVVIIAVAIAAIVATAFIVANVALVVNVMIVVDVATAFIVVETNVHVIVNSVLK